MKIPSIRLVFGHHITATEKRHIAEMISKNLASGSTKRKSYRIVSRKGLTLDLIISEPDTDSHGRRFLRSRRVTVESIGGILPD